MSPMSEGAFSLLTHVDVVYFQSRLRLKFATIFNLRSSMPVIPTVRQISDCVYKYK